MKYKAKSFFLIIFCVIFFGGAFAFAESKSNLEVNGIVEGDPRMAIVNGRIVQPGEVVNDFKIEEINEKFVKFSKGEQIIDVEVGENKIIALKNPEPDKAKPEAKKHSTEKIYISLNPPSAFNFKTKAEILNMRKKNMEQRPLLEPAKYEPAKEVFGRIEDNKPWWGVLGMSFYGPGPSSINGMSKESRFVLNPYLLVGLAECKPQKVENTSLTPEPVYPEAVELYWQEDKSFAKATYRIQEYWKKQVKYDYPEAGDKDVCLTAYNARDFGFNYLYINPQDSRNITSPAMDNPVQINQSIQSGTNCGYAGGCNHMSPVENDLSLVVKAVPATIHMSLWKNLPKSPKEKGDMNFIIEIV